MTPGEQYRADLKRQKQHEKSVKSQADWALRQHKQHEKFLKDVRQLKLDTLYKPIPDRNSRWSTSGWSYFVVRERNIKQETLTLEILMTNTAYGNTHAVSSRYIERKIISFNDYKHLLSTFERVLSKKEKTMVGLRGLMP
jgi:hypothetical protein